jgi:dihydroorotate dehydrogenase
MYKSIIRPFFFRFDAEEAHHFAMNALRVPLFSKSIAPFAKVNNPQLNVNLWGINFGNPIGVAAGFDKDGTCLPAWENLGFGYAEIGTITPRPQPGNPLPRIFRIPSHQALINRMGFPNDGLETIIKRFDALKKSGKWPHIPIGINIGKQKSTLLDEAGKDYLECFLALKPYADYFAINISSPNTPGLRQLQQKDALNQILRPIVEANLGGDSKPVVVKIAPDLVEKDIMAVLECIMENQLHGIIATNTTIDKTAVPLKEDGGLSGAPLRQHSTDIIRFISKETGGKLPIIGVGGIFTADDAKEKLDAGASLLQIYTGFIYEGPLVVRSICDGLVK